MDDEDKAFAEKQRAGTSLCLLRSTKSKPVAYSLHRCESKGRTGSQDQGIQGPSQHRRPGNQEEWQEMSGLTSQEDDEEEGVTLRIERVYIRMVKGILYTALGLERREWDFWLGI